MGTSHHWYLKAQVRWQGQGYPQVCIPQAHPMPTAHSPSPNGHEVEDVGHARAVAQEAADADLEHDGNHQDPVPAGGAGGTKTGQEEMGTRWTPGNWVRGGQIAAAGRCSKHRTLASPTGRWPYTRSGQYHPFS